jgi:RNA polymerase sigma factor (sigma-70 family)
MMSAPHSEEDFDRPESSTGKRDLFPETQWSVVRKARTEHAGRARQALDQLYKAYWPALYVMARGQGLSAEDAEDAVQDLFATRILAGSLLDNADPAHGRFRVLVKTALERTLIDGWRRDRAGKRDVRKAVSLESQEGESLFQSLPARGLGPEELADRAWVEQVLSRSLECTREAHGPVEVGIFEQVYWSKPGTPDWSDVAQRLGILLESLQRRVQRVLKTFRAAVRAEVRETVENADAFEEELLWLFRMIGGAL